GYDGDLLDERIIEGREPALGASSAPFAAAERGDVELRSVRDVARRVRERPAVRADREAPQLPLSGRHLANRTATRGHAKQMHVAARLSVEVDRLPVRRPRRRARVEIPVRSEIAGGAASRRDDADVILQSPTLGAS